MMKRQKDQNCVVSHPHLDDDVLETIFSHLPIKDAHRVSILSKRFRHSWRFCRDLSFDRNFAQNMSSKDEFKNTVNKFFHHHLNTAADRFRLHFDAADDVKLVSDWTQTAVSLGIEEIELDLTPSKKKFTLSYDLVDVDTVKIMRLVNCELDLPLTSNGLRQLTELTLEKVSARPVLVKAVFGNCLALRSFKLVRCNRIYNLRIFCGPDLKGFKTLVVENCTDYDSVTINAPSLSCLRYRGKICEFRFECELEKLNDVVLEIEHCKDFRMLPRRKEMVIGLAFVRVLTVTTAFLEGLSGRIEQMDFYFWKLTKFQLLVTSESYINPSDIAIFLKKCPRVDTVFIDIGHNAFGNSTYWNIKGRKILSEWKTLLPMLKYVKLEGFTLKEQPVAMARFFLKNAIYLTSLFIMKAKNYKFPQTFSPNCLVSGILSNANIEIYEYNRDATATATTTRIHEH